MRGLVAARWRLAQESRDALEYAVLPGLAAVLPWRWAFAVFRLLARWPGLYRADAEQAVAQAIAHGACCGEPGSMAAQRFAWERRLVQLVDHADHYLFRTRSARWLERHVDVTGAWPAEDRAGMLWTFHWGAGMWALAHAGRTGIMGHMVLSAPRGPDFAGRRIFGWYVRARMRSVEQALHRPIVFVPGGMAGVRSAIERSEQLVVVIDVPEDQVGPVRMAQLRGAAVSVPAALPDMACDRALPVTVFTMGLDVDTGRRQLRILNLGVYTDSQGLSDAVFAELDALLATEPAAWHLWAQALRFFRVRAGDNRDTASK